MAAEGTLARLAGDGLMIVFNDPLPCDDAAGRAVRLAVAMRDRVWELAEGWSRLGFELQLAAGIAQGHATIGRIGFEGRAEYAPVGRVPTLAERLCETRRGRADPGGAAGVRGHRGGGDHAAGGGVGAARVRSGGGGV